MMTSLSLRLLWLVLLRQALHHAPRGSVCRRHRLRWGAANAGTSPEAAGNAGARPAVNIPPPGAGIHIEYIFLNERHQERCQGLLERGEYSLM